MRELFKLHKRNILFALIISAFLILLGVVFAHAQEVYKQQTGQTQVVLVIHPAKEGKKPKKKTFPVVSSEGNVWERVFIWIKKSKDLL